MSHEREGQSSAPAPAFGTSVPSVVLRYACQQVRLLADRKDSLLHASLSMTDLHAITCCHVGCQPRCSEREAHGQYYRIKYDSQMELAFGKPGWMDTGPLRDRDTIDQISEALKVAEQSLRGQPGEFRCALPELYESCPDLHWRPATL